jgi:hypothetical protein
MAILIAALTSFAFGIAAYFLLLLADGRRLEKSLFARPPRAIIEGTAPEASLAAPDHPLWMASSFAGPKALRQVTPRSLYPTTPGTPGLGG